MILILKILFCGVDYYKEMNQPVTSGDVYNEQAFSIT